ARRGLRRARCDRGAERLGLHGTPVPDGQLVAGVQQAPRDPAAHRTEPYDCDPRHGAIMPKMGLGQLAAFLGVSLVVIVTPGQDTALTIRNSLTGGRRGGVLTALGVVTGQLSWALAASAGLSA